MPRRPAGRHLSRDAVLLLVKQQLELAGAHGITKREMLDAIGPERTSLVTIQSSTVPIPIRTPVTELAPTG